MTDTPDSADPGPAALPTPRIRVFGGIGVESSDGPVSIGGPKQRRLLALLVARAGTVVSLDWLSEHLWDDDERPDPTTPALRTYVSRLRRSLPPEAQAWIATEGGGYRFTAAEEATDHRRFAMLRAGATRARGLDDPLTAQNLLDQALALWTGDPFPELEDLDWARADIEQLRMDRLEMMEERWEAVLALGRHTQITGELAAFTAEHGLRDRAARQYALALHRSGRTTEALRVIDEHRRTLAEESGLDPSAEIIELEQALLSGDPSLTIETTGRPLRGYRLLEEIGAGAFSVVWRGVQPSVNREVAIKQIRPELASQPDFIRRFETEAQLVARIEHPHIVPMIDFWRDPDSAYLVMRWLRGGTLERRLDDGPMTVDATTTLARQVGGALSAAHARGVVHRDVKSANILFDEQGHAFLTDFGIALAIADSGGAEAALSQGSPAYASPEQIRREPLGPRADVFSLAVVLYECLAGALPFRDSQSMDELVRRQLQTPFPPLSEWRPDVPEHITDAVARATAKDAGERFGSIEEFLLALQADQPAPGDDETPASAVDATLENPYKGLEAFHDGDRDQFFGRERLIAEMLERLSGTGPSARCLVVVGPSGSGKSSVVRAGLVPALRTGALPGSAKWFATTMVPATDPYDSFASALMRVAVNPPASLGPTLRDGERGLLRGLRACLGGADDKVLFTIDQFEELFTSSSTDDADRFLDALTVAVEDPTSPLRLVATLRADYYHRPLEHPAFARVVRACAIDVPPLAGDELERAIIEPARRVGITFEPGLVPRIAADTVGQPSPLPLLQYMLSELFERRSGASMTIAAYDDLGGLSGALTTQAEEIYASADDGERDSIRRVLGRLTNPGEHSADLRRRVPLSDLGDDAPTAWMLAEFGAARLVTFDRDDTTREPTVEVAHEALLREWPRLVSWLRDDQDLLRIADAVSSGATVWETGGREWSDLLRGSRLDAAIDLYIAAPDRLRDLDVEFVNASRLAAEAERRTEQQRVRRLRRLVVGVGAALVVALVAGGLALRQQQRADDEAQRAQQAAADAERQAGLAEEQAALAAEQTTIAEEQTAAALAAAEDSEIATLVSRSAALSAEDPALSILLALEAHRRRPGAETEYAVLNALGSGNLPTRIFSLQLVPGDVNCDSRRISGDRSVSFGIFGGLLVSGPDPSTGEFVDRGPTPAPCVAWAGDEELDRRWVQTSDGLRLWLGPFAGEFDVDVEFDVPTFVVGDRMTDAGRLVVVSSPDGTETAIGLLDDRTGRAVGSTLRTDGALIEADVSVDGTRVAVSVETVDGTGRIFVLDGIDGRQLSTIDTALPAAAMTWDPRTSELIAVTFDGQVLTIDAPTGEIVSNVRSAATSRILDVAVRPDGLLTVVSQGQVEIVDRRSGPARAPVSLRNAAEAWARADGAVVSLSSDSRFEVFEVDGNPLTETAHPVDPFSSFAFNQGLAGGVRTPGGQVEIVDLATGDRRAPQLFAGAGEPFDAARIHPEADGLWAITFDSTIARFEGDRLAEQIELGGIALTGTRYENRWAVLTEQPDGRVVDLVDLERGAARVVVRIPAPRATTVHPAIGGGVHIVTDRAVMTYDDEGVLVGEVSTTGGEFRERGIGVGIITLDPSTGNLALGGGQGGVLLVDLETEAIESLPVSDAVANLGFARDGELLVITGFDGTVRLWDIERNSSAGVVWTGSGAVPGSPSWYDAETETVWVSTSGKLLQITVDPARWLEQACVSAGRNITQEEWDRYVPGDQLLWITCLDQLTVI